MLNIWFTRNRIIESKRICSCERAMNECMQCVSAVYERAG